MLNWIKAAFGRAGQTLSLVSPWLRSVYWLISRSFEILAREAYGTNSVVYACLRLLSTSVPEPPLLAYTLDAKAERTPLPFGHPLRQLIRRPNPIQTEYEMWELVTLHMAIVGRSHWYKQRDNLGRISALWPLRPDRVGPRYAGSPTEGVASTQTERARNSDQQVLAGWAYWQPGLGEPINLDLSDVLTFNLPDPAGETGGLVEGLGPLQVLAREVEVDNEATNYVGALVKNYGTPGVVLSLKQGGISREQAQKAKRIFAEEFGGTKRGEPAIVDGDTTITQLGFDLNKLEFPALRDVSETRVAAAFGVPAILVGLKSGLQSGIRATIAEQREYFAETTLSNWWRRLSDQYTNDVASEYGDNIVTLFDTSQVKALQAQGRYETDRVATAFGQGAVTINEYRTRVLQLPPLPAGGDVLMLPQGATETPTTEEGIAEAASQAASDDAVSDKPGKAARKGLRVLPARKAALPSDDGYEDAVDPAELQDAIDGDLAGITETHSAKLADYLASVAEALASALVAHPGTVPLLSDGQRSALSELIRAIWTAAMAAGYDRAAASLGVGISFDLANPRVSDALGLLANGHWKSGPVGVDAATQQAIRDTVEQGAAEGLGPEALAERIRGLWAFSPSRAMTIARTESGYAYNIATAIGYQDSGVVTHVRVMDGVDFDDACRAANGQIWPLQDAYANPLQHPRCRRAFAPVVKAQSKEAAA